MAKILLVRHGTNDMVDKKLAGRLPGVNLNEQGRTQAIQLAEILKNLPIEGVISSPLERTYQTAEPIALMHRLPIEINQGLQEMDFGEWEGKPFSQLKKLNAWKLIQEQPSLFCFPGGESFVEAQQRMVAALNVINKAYSEKDLVVCVSHCDMIKLAVAFYLQMPLNAFQRLQINPVSVTLLNLHDENVSFGPINATAVFSIGY